MIRSLLAAHLLTAGCIPEEADFILIPAVVDTFGNVRQGDPRESPTGGDPRESPTGGDPATITLQLTLEWQNGERAPETQVTVDSRIGLENDSDQSVLGRVPVNPVGTFDNVLSPGEQESVPYEGTQSLPYSGGPDPEALCDGRSVHAQVQYNTTGSLGDAPRASVSNSFVFECD